MKKLTLITVVLFGTILAKISFAADPVKTDGDKYKVILENERVRVFKYDDKPGDKTHMHDHNDFTLYALAPFKRKLTFSDGKSITRQEDRQFKGRIVQV